MKKSLQLIWLISLILTFILAYSLNHFFPFKKALDRNEVPRSPVTSSIINQQVKLEIPNSKEIIPVEIPTTAQEVFDSIESLFTHQELLKKRIYQSINTLAEDEVLKLLLLYKNKNINQYITKHLLLKKYAEYNPQSAIAYVQRNIKTENSKNRSFMDVLRVWAKNSPELAYAWYIDALKNSSSIDKLDKSHIGFRSIFENLAKQDISDAMLKLTDLQDNYKDLELATKGVMDSFDQRADFIAFIDQSSDINSVFIRRTVIQDWLIYKPEEMSIWLETQPETLEKQTLQKRVFSRWVGRGESQKAAIWYLNTASSENKRQYLETIVRAWRKDQPQAALNWIKHQKEINTQTSINLLLSSASYSQPNFVKENLGLIDNIQLQQRVAFRLYLTYLGKESPMVAENYLTDSAHKEYIDTQFIQYKLDNPSHFQN